MPEQFDPTHEIAVDRLMRQLLGFARGLGLDDAVVREIVVEALITLPDTDDSDRLIEARGRMMLAASYS